VDIDIYGFLLAGLLIIMGALGDRLGKRRLLLIGAATFAVAPWALLSIAGAALVDLWRMAAIQV
jgi:MFS transporter, DHA2 family, multidrug resistance protein